MSRERAGLPLAAVAFAAVLLTSFPTLTPEAHRLAAIIAAVVVLWVTEAIPLPATALLGVAAAVALAVAPAREAFAPFADPLMFLFIGAFMLARAIFVHGLNRRVAYAVLSLPWVGESPGRILLAFGAVTAAISGWISNTATTAMMFGIGISILAAMGEDARRSPYATALMLMTSFSASIGGLATPIGTPPNVIGLGFIRAAVGEEVSFFRWMMLGVPTVLVLYAVLFGWLRFVSRDAAGDLTATRELIRRERATLGPWTSGQRSVAIAFGLTVFLWVLPGIVALAAGERSAAFRTLNERLPEGVAAIAGALLLFLLPGQKGRRAITWDEAVKIDWGVVLLYGGGFALGVLSFKTGLAEAAGRGLTGLLPISGELGLLIASVGVAIVLSEATSNTAAANMVVPVVISIAQASGMDPFEPALGATMAASLGFMLPVSTPCNAIVYGSGLIPLGKMIRYGAVLDVAGAVVIVVSVRLLGSIVR
ncbi:MAG TPA: DASS family sodium-coupled anion symporter [Gemmatimonadales bacterium]|jgi:sodium-dependent dicarboxylate transporter 2/3/5|nr:DASS family sodium-coupled anion symporter [Gemmatimonadales bacterium]